MAASLTCLARSAESEVLLRAYIRYSLAQEVLGQAETLAENLNEPEADQIRRVAADWFANEAENMRQELAQRFGDRARSRFETFVSQFTHAENIGDSAYLDHLSDKAGLREPPADYGALRRLALERWLNEPLGAGTRLLSEMQTWAEVRGKQPDAPPLDYWLEREIAQPEPEPEPRRPVNPLAAAEAPAHDWEDRPAPSASALDSFARRRQERREQAMQSAQAGMQQMAQERQAAEEEYAARVQADAQADAEAMRSQAQQLAAVEAEAMAQRENSWGNRIKRIVGGTVSAGLGAFTGGIGAEAGQRAVDEIFR